jgi:hypothetical protein
MSIMFIISCYTGFFNVRRGWQSLDTGPRFYLRLIWRTGWLLIYTSRTTDGCLFKPKKLSVSFLYPGVPAGLAPFRGLVPLGRRNLVPILPPAHPLGGGICILKKNGKYNGHKKKYKYKSTNTIYKTKDRVRRTPLKTGGELRWSGCGRQFMHSSNILQKCF